MRFPPRVSLPHCCSSQAIVINNRRVLHARSEFIGSRRLCGAYVQQEEWMGRVRHHLAAIPLLQ